MVKYIIKDETYLKAQIMCRGVRMTPAVLDISAKENAKRQNMIYNMPFDTSASWPQELLIRNASDGYESVVSCVTKGNLEPVYLDSLDGGRISAYVDGCEIPNVDIHFVEEPQYYTRFLNNGESVKKYVTACGQDELNIIPWKGCSISGCCLFCGINNFIQKDELSSFMISKNPSEWENGKRKYLACLKEAVEIALQSKCYDKHTHVILIAGNLANELLDYEADVFAEIAQTIQPLVKDKSHEGIIAVITPPNSFHKLEAMKNSGIEKVVFNFEAISRRGFSKYCPGKSKLGYDYFLERLLQAVKIFGKGNVWTNLVFGLEDTQETLEHCKQIIAQGIVVGANILHLDRGNRLDCRVPLFADVIRFFYELEILNSGAGFKPFYCSKALRTSLSNEAHDKRITC